MDVSADAIRYLADAIAEAELGRKVFADGLAAALSLRGEPEVASMLHQARLRAAANTLPKNLADLREATTPKKITRKAKR